jgi:DNA-binding NtrC family response regulator
MAPSLILCEKTSRWAAALRAALRDLRPQSIETRSIAGCQAALDESPASIVAIEVTATNLDAAVEFVARCSLRTPRSAAVALMASQLSSAAALFREAGALDVATSMLDAPRLAKLVRRHFEQAPQPALSVRQLAAERLPWSAHASNQPGGR